MEQVSEKVSHDISPGASSRPSLNDVEAPAAMQDDAAKIHQSDEYIHGFRLWIVSTALTLVCFLMLLDISIISTATPKITSEFRSLSNVGWYGAAYQLAAAALQPLSGKIYSNFSTKWTFFVYFLVFEIGSLLCAVSTSSNMLIVSRAVAGMGGAGLSNGAITIIAGCAPMPKRPALLGIVMGGSQLGLVGGPLIGGLFTEYVSWRWCFYINLPIGGLVAALLFLTRIPEQVKKPQPREVLRNLHHKLDLFGFALFVPWNVMLLLAIQWGGNQYAWGSSIVIGLLCGAAGIAAIWLYWNYREKDNAMIPWPMFKKQYVWTSCLNIGFLASAMFITSYYLPICITDLIADFQGVLGKGPALSGVFLLPGIASQIIGAVLSGKLIGTFGYYLPWSVASGVLTTIGAGLLSTLSPSTPAGEWIGYQIIAGAGRGFGFQVPIIAVQNTLKPAQIPTAMSLVMFSQTFGGALFLSFADTILTNRLRDLLKSDVPEVNAEDVVGAGLYGLKSSVPQEYLTDVLKAYAKSVDSVFYLCIGLSGACFVLAWGMGWVDIRGEKERTEKK